MCEKRNEVCCNCAEMRAKLMLVEAQKGVYFLFLCNFCWKKFSELFKDIKAKEAMKEGKDILDDHKFAGQIGKDGKLLSDGEAPPLFKCEFCRKKFDRLGVEEVWGYLICERCFVRMRVKEQP